MAKSSDLEAPEFQPLLAPVDKIYGELSASLTKEVGDMWRAFFLAFGIWLCLLGAQCLVIERAVLAESVASSAPLLTADGTFTAPGTRPEIETREWMPFTFLGLGLVTILYTFTLPKRSGP